MNTKWVSTVEKIFFNLFFCFDDGDAYWFLLFSHGKASNWVEVEKEKKKKSHQHIVGAHSVLPLRASHRNIHFRNFFLRCFHLHYETKIPWRTMKQQKNIWVKIHHFADNVFDTARVIGEMAEKPCIISVSLPLSLYFHSMEVESPSSSRWSNNISHRLWQYTVHYTSFMTNFYVHRALHRPSLSLRRWILRTETEIVSNNFTIHIFPIFFLASLVLRLLSFGIFVLVRRSGGGGSLVFLVTFFLSCNARYLTLWHANSNDFPIWFALARHIIIKVIINVHLVVFLLNFLALVPLSVLLSLSLSSRLILFVGGAVRFANVFSGQLMCCWLLQSCRCVFGGDGSTPNVLEDYHYY